MARSAARAVVRKSNTAAIVVQNSTGNGGSSGQQKRTHNREHRADNFDESVFEDILYRMMNGESVTSICRDPKMPCYSVLTKWINSTPETYNQYARARQIQAEYFVDEMIDIADNDTNMIRSRNRIMARQWHVSKILPKKYGDKITQEITQTVNQKFSLDLSVLDGDARAKLRESILNSMKSGKTIDGDYEVEG